jgi:hypothetical protein
MGLGMSKRFALDELVKAIHEFRKFTGQLLTLRGGKVRLRSGSIAGIKF